MIKIKKFDNGLTVAVHEMPQMSSAAIGVWVNVGGRYENVKNSGISHFVEHMVFKGTENRTCQQIKEEIEGIGGYLNAFTSEEFTCYYAKSIGHEYKGIINVLFDLVINPLFAKKDILQERHVIIEEIKMYLDLPMSYVHDMLDEIMWKGHPLGMSLTGTIKSVSSFKREDFAAFKNKFYAPNNMLLSCSGNISFDQVVDYVSKNFVNQPKQPAHTYELVNDKQKKPNIKILNKELEQTHMALGIKAIHRKHPLRYAMGILNIILGGNMSSRLFKEVREERGLVYEIKSSMTKYQDTGVFEISAGMEHSQLIETLDVILSELRRIREEKVSLGEFNRAKRYYIGTFLMALEKTTDYMLWIGERILTDNLETKEQIIADIEAVTIDDVLKAANEVIDNKRLNLAVIGKQEDAAAIERVFVI